MWPRSNEMKISSQSRATSTVKAESGPTLFKSFHLEHIGHDGDEKGPGGKPDKEQVENHPETPGYIGSVVDRGMAVRSAGLPIPQEPMIRPMTRQGH